MSGLHFGNAVGVAQAPAAIYYGTQSGKAKTVEKIYCGDANGKAKLVYEISVDMDSRLDTFLLDKGGTLA